MRKLSLLITALFVGGLYLSPAQAGRFSPQSAQYELYRGGTTLGQATVTLSATEQPQCYVYSYTAKPAWLFRWATGSITERSEFCEQDGRLLPSYYRYHRSGIGADDENFSLRFDADKRIVTDQNGVEREWPEGAVDKLGVQLEALRLVEGMSFPVEERRLTVQIIDDDRFKEYTLAVTGAETIKVPAGEFETIRVERVLDPKKSTRFWVAPALDYLLIKVEQQRDDDPVIGIALKKVPRSLANKPGKPPS